jgi:hypothetical protein
MTDYRYIYSRKLKLRSTGEACLFLVLFVLVMGVVGRIEQEPPPAIVQPVSKSRTQQQIETILPEVYAKPIAERTAYPRTMAAIAYRETVRSGKDHTAIGDGGESRGLFQIQPKWHGPVPDEIEAQIDKANDLFLDYVRRFGYRKAVQKWNGEGEEARAYQHEVLALVRELER